ncbi:RimK family alpha-L-glutamate ligase [Paenibacillus sp. YYML68]|uniref:ATP-grasp domain-containing protein n=1 Tax=Paenibacillus sp. YYML68 TaxID=2909250 RepID=UPI00249155DA|nr:ATP-grasp domain-containing protein [Paenibacillus sp. YYML68]
MLTGWLVYNEADAARNRDYIRWMLDEAEQLGLRLQLKLKERLVFGAHSGGLFIREHGVEAKLPTFVIMRNIDSLFSRQCELLGVKVFNSSAVSELANHKARTYQWLAQHGIPMPQTYFIHQHEYEAASFQSLTFPMVLKAVDGRGGTEVHRVDSLSELTDYVESGERGRSYVLQRMAQPGRDVRVFVIGRRIVGAVLRSSQHDFRANHSLGGDSSLYELDEEQRCLVDRITRLIELGMAGIDFMFDEHGQFVFNELEDVVGSRTLSLHSEVNIVRLYLSWIIEQLHADEAS